MEQKEKLFEKFPPISTKEWMDKITADLKGVDFNKKLVWKTGEGFDLMPFYRLEDIDKLKYIDSFPGSFPFLRGNKTSGNSWLVRQNIEVTDYASANKKSLEILMKGVDSLGFIIMDPGSVSQTNFDILLKDIIPGAAELNFLCNGKAKEITGIIDTWASENGHDKTDINGAFEADPLGRLMINGTLCVPPSDGFDYLASLFKTGEQLPSFRLIHLNASHFRNAGSGITEELAYAVSMACEYMNQLVSRGIDPALAASKIRFSFGTGSSYFPEIAKLRAARLLWSAVLNKFLTDTAAVIPMNIHSVTSHWNLTVFDPYVNMLRTQTEAMSAVLGGTDSLTVEPFNTAFTKPGDFSERIARNQQLILKEEAYFDKVADPVAGSYYVEYLTSMIAEAAWKLFVETEAEGGFLKCLETGKIQKTIEDSAGKKVNELATRKTVLLGTNQYPNLSERLHREADLNKIFSEARPAGADVKPLKIFRVSEEYDRLRISVDRASSRPKVFLMPLGNVTMRKARAQFSSGFFGCAGFEVIDNRGFSDVESAIKAAIDAVADIVVICSSDDEYTMFAQHIYKQLKDRMIIVIAGSPASSDELKAIGIKDFIHLKSNVTDTLYDFVKRLGMLS